MKCSRCGHRANTLKAMAAHCRKKHPGAMKATHRKRNTPINAAKTADKLQRLEKLLELLG